LVMLSENEKQNLRRQVTREVIRRSYGEELYREIATAKSWKENL